ncbi:heme ABC transporter ATP-binding protein [Marivita sp. S0852]|uniref:heme ABC transporter ATP-binding protein n=1 Tax=Marivita sp. S0852 TaxID=3373893 RepID=UPI003982B920
MLLINDLNVHFGAAHVLKNVSLSALPGAVTCIVGPNGSGKTTTLRAATGDVAYEGSITLNGHSLKRLEPWQAARLRGVLPQSSTLAFPFTVIEVVRIGLHTGEAGDQDHIALAALDKVDLAGYTNRPYHELSGGEQQRVHLARVLAQIPDAKPDDDPRWLFLDEPVASLDIAHQLQVMKIARDFADAGGGVVAVMHDLNLTSMFADKIVLMSDGSILAVGHPARVMTNATLSRAYRCDLRVSCPPPGNLPFLLPHAARAAAE